MKVSCRVVTTAIMHLMYHLAVLVLQATRAPHSHRWRMKAKAVIDTASVKPVRAMDQTTDNI